MQPELPLKATMSIGQNAQSNNFIYYREIPYQDSVIKMSFQNGAVPGILIEGGGFGKSVTISFTPEKKDANPTNFTAVLFIERQIERRQFYKSVARFMDSLTLPQALLLLQVKNTI